MKEPVARPTHGRQGGLAVSGIELPRDGSVEQTDTESRFWGMAGPLVQGGGEVWQARAPSAHLSMYIGKRWHFWRSSQTDTLTFVPSVRCRRARNTTSSSAILVFETRTYAGNLAVCSLIAKR